MTQDSASLYEDSEQSYLVVNYSFLYIFTVDFTCRQVKACYQQVFYLVFQPRRRGYDVHIFQILRNTSALCNCCKPGVISGLKGCRFLRAWMPILSKVLIPSVVSFQLAKDYWNCIAIVYVNTS